MEEKLKDRLKTEFGLNDDQISKLEAEGVKAEGDVSTLTAEEIKSMTGIGLVIARNIAKAFAPTTTTTSSIGASITSLDVLPTVPNDESWLAALKVGGVLKFSKETVIGTVSAALANRVGLYGLPKKLVEAMERQAQSLEEPVGSEFFAMQRALTEHNYGEIFAAIPGASGRYATDARKKELLSKMDDGLWPELIGFQNQVSNWMDGWMKTASNPMMLTAAIAGLSGAGNAGLPPGIMQPPPTDPLRDAAEAVITSINRIFAGTGILVSTALAYDAQQIRLALENPALPAQVGAANRDQMLKQLGVAVSSDYPRLEQSVKRYTLGVIELPNVTPGQTELAFVTALFQLGSTIPWDKLEHGSDIGRAGIGKKVVNF